MKEEIERLREERSLYASVIEKCWHGRTKLPPEEAGEVVEAREAIRKLDQRIKELLEDG